MPMYPKGKYIFFLIIDTFIIANGLSMFIRVLESADSLEQSARYFSASWDTYLFLTRKFFFKLINL